ncbi:MAG: hypothetical protein MZV63_25200 [Marinilabiliales bacterium]|nr:hypothetical protein [Marinilabiliales bacterium]
MQLTADIFNMEASRPHTYETITNAAINAAVGMKFYGDYTSAVSAMTRPGEKFMPDSRNVDIYKELYSKVYSRMYRHLQPLYNQIRNITGYLGKYEKDHHRSPSFCFDHSLVCQGGVVRTSMS